jgi:hypothetical protein
MKDDDATQDRRTRVDGNRVIHTVKGSLYHGDAAEPPRGLTAEQDETQRTGWKLDERQTREAAVGEQQASASGDPDATQPMPGRGRKHGTDEWTESRGGKRD